eukprot:53323_1
MSDNLSQTIVFGFIKDANNTVCKNANIPQSISVICKKYYHSIGVEYFDKIDSRVETDNTKTKLSVASKIKFENKSFGKILIDNNTTQYIKHSWKFHVPQCPVLNYVHIGLESVSNGKQQKYYQYKVSAYQEIEMVYYKSKLQFLWRQQPQHTFTVSKKYKQLRCAVCLDVCIGWLTAGPTYTTVKLKEYKKEVIRS